MKVASRTRAIWLRIAIALPLAAGILALLWWRGPNLHAVGNAFSSVRWEWVVAAIGLNLASVVARSVAWQTVICSAMAPPHPTYQLTFSAFSVGLFANAVLPGRIGELARVAVLARRFPGRRGIWATLVGTVFAHRVFDIVPVLLLVGYVLATAKIPAWAFTGLLIAIGVGVGLFAFAFASARRHDASPAALERLSSARRILAMSQQGLGVMHEPVAAGIAVLFQCLGWLCQLFAVWAAMRAFHIHSPLPAAALVLLLMNVVTIFPVWPGNVGLLQAAIATPLKVSYGVAYARGIAFGFGLQAIEASVGIGVGLIFLGKEGLSFAMLKVMPDASQADMSEEAQGIERDSRRDSARVSG